MLAPTWNQGLQPLPAVGTAQPGMLFQLLAAMGTAVEREPHQDRQDKGQQPDVQRRYNPQRCAQGHKDERQQAEHEHQQPHLSQRQLQGRGSFSSLRPAR